MTFAEAEYDGKRRKTRREKFLEQMNAWKRLEGKIRPHSTLKYQSPAQFEQAA